MNNTDQVDGTTQTTTQEPAQSVQQGLGSPQTEDTTGVATPPPPPPPPGTTPLMTPDGKTIQPNYQTPSHPLVVGGDAGMKNVESPTEDDEVMQAVQQIKSALSVIEEKLSKK